MEGLKSEISNLHVYSSTDTLSVKVTRLESHKSKKYRGAFLQQKSVQEHMLIRGGGGGGGGG